MSDGTAIVCGSFELSHPVGVGGVATVWKGRHRERDVPVAVKVVTNGDALGRKGREAFRSEVRAQAGLDHPGISTVFEYGRISTEAEAASGGELTAGSPYCALEFAPGGSLREQASIDNWPLLQSLLLEVLDALAHAHARGVVHRDLKPENVLYFPGATSGRFKLSDFGIAHAVGGEVGADTESIDDASAGTPYYMPPEQLQGEWRVFGPWTDLYALGCMAYEIVDGSVPFEGENAVQVATKQLTEQPDPMEPDFPIPRGLRAWIRCLLAKDLRDRFRRAADAAWMLSQMPSAVDETRVAEPTGAKAGASEDPPKAEFTGRRSRTKRMWSVERGSAEVESEAEERSTLLFERPQPQLTTLAAQSTAEIEHLDPEVHEEPRREPLEAAFQAGPPPPLPQSWKSRLHERPSAAVLDAGLELFGLRELPFVGREEGRDRVWRALDEVFEERAPRLVEIRGEAGTGKTRLAEWIARRAHEVGAVQVLSASHSRRGGPTEGLPAMLESELSLWGLDRRRTYRRILSQIQARYDRLEQSVRELEDEARALTEIVAPTSGSAPDEGGPRYRFSAPEERYAAIGRFLEELARERPILVVLDDLSCGIDSARFVEYVTRHFESLPVLFVVTAREGDLREHSEVSSVLERLQADERTERIDLGRLKGARRAELCHRLLPLEFDSAQRLLERAEGLPLHAVQQLGSWIDRDALGIGGGGFEVCGEARSEPGSLGEVWRRRLEHALEQLHRRGGEEVEVALELAAALGPHVDLEEWRAVCERAGVAAPEILYGTLIRRGLARSRTQGWSFVHRQFVEAVARRAQRGGRWEEHHRQCAETLGELYSRRNPRMQRRVVEHYRRAGAPERALAPMLAFARYLYECGAHERLAHLLDEREAIVAEYDTSESAALENLELRARLALDRRELERAEMLAETLRDRAAEVNDDEALGWGHLLTAAARAGRETDAGIEGELASAEEAFERAGADRGRGRVLFEYGRWYRERGERERAGEMFRRAGEVFAANEVEKRALEARAAAAVVRAGDGEADAAERALEAICERAKELGCSSLRARAWRQLGAIRESRGDAKGADGAYQYAESLRPAGARE